MTVVQLTPNEAFAPVLVGYGTYTGPLKFKRGVQLPIYMTRIAALMRDPAVRVEIIR